MYLSMTQEEFEEVINEAPRTVAKRLGIDYNQDNNELFKLILKADPLASGLLDKYIGAYTEWWETSRASTQSDLDWEGTRESAKIIQRLIGKRGHMCSALRHYLNAQHPYLNRKISDTVGHIDAN